MSHSGMLESLVPFNHLANYLSYSSICSLTFYENSMKTTRNLNEANKVSAPNAESRDTAVNMSVNRPIVAFYSAVAHEDTDEEQLGEDTRNDATRQGAAVSVPGKDPLFRSASNLTTPKAPNQTSATKVVPVPDTDEGKNKPLYQGLIPVSKASCQKYNATPFKNKTFGWIVANHAVRVYVEIMGKLKPTVEEKKFKAYVLRYNQPLLQSFDSGIRDEQIKEYVEGEIHKSNKSKKKGKKKTLKDFRLKAAMIQRIWPMEYRALHVDEVVQEMKAPDMPPTQENMSLVQEVIPAVKAPDPPTKDMAMTQEFQMQQDMPDSGTEETTARDEDTSKECAIQGWESTGSDEAEDPYENILQKESLEDNESEAAGIQDEAMEDTFLVEKQKEATTEEDTEEDRKRDGNFLPDRSTCSKEAKREAEQVTAFNVEAAVIDYFPLRDCVACNTNKDSQRAFCLCVDMYSDVCITLQKDAQLKQVQEIRARKHKEATEGADNTVRSLAMLLH